MKTIQVKSRNHTYPIIIQNNLLQTLRDHLDMNRFYVIVSDNQIPQVYIETVREACENHLFISFPAGEQSKSFSEYERIISLMQKHNVSRDACLIALGGGVTGDLSGFVAATYLRGIDFIQIPTTLLSQIDSSVGGKVAINTSDIKNSVGNFYAPIKVLIDPLTLQTLSNRHFNNGMAEMIKYGMIHSEKLFNEIELQNVKENLEYFIEQSLLIKKYYVENDELESSLRQKLNFGHTFGHAYEAFYHFDKYLHGEAISLGMIKVCDNIDIKNRLKSVLQKFDLPIEDEATDAVLMPYIKKDKKNTIDGLHLIIVDQIGSATIKKVNKVDTL